MQSSTILDTSTAAVQHVHCSCVLQPGSGEMGPYIYILLHSSKKKSYFYISPCNAKKTTIIFQHNILTYTVRLFLNKYHVDLGLATPVHTLNE